MDIIKSIRESSVLMNVIIDQLNTGVYIIDQDYNIVPFNSHFEDLLQYSYYKKDGNFCDSVIGCLKTESCRIEQHGISHCLSCELVRAVSRALEEQIATRNEIVVREYKKEEKEDGKIRRYYRYSCKPLTLEGVRLAILMIDDITKIEEKSSALYEQNLIIQKYNDHFQKDLALAKGVQNSIIPKKAVCFGEYNIDFMYFPLDEIGGDMFDIIHIDDIKIGIFLCDVIGHGLPAALVTTMIKALLANNRRNLASPADMMNNINYELVHMLDEPYLTAFYGVLDVRYHTFKFVRAGHPFPWLIDGSGVQTFGHISNPMIGLDDQTSYQVEEISLSQNDKVILYTDGLLGVGEKNELYEKKLLDFLDSKDNLTGQELLELMRNDMKKTIANNTHIDDVCALMIEHIGEEKA